jgi:hypothetical protein
MARRNQQQQPRTIEPLNTPAAAGFGLAGNESPEVLERARELTAESLGAETIDKMHDAMHDNVRGPGMDISEQHSEEIPPPAAPAAKPATAKDLRDKRITYPAKPAARCGDTVTSLSREDLGNRTKQSTVLVVCPDHHTPCYAGTSNGIYTTMYCSVLGCNWSHKMVTPTVAQKLNERLRRDEQLPHAQQDISPR